LQADLADLFERRLDRGLHPDRVEIVDELPRSYLGKVLRREVRQWLARGPAG
jgi:acyl-coenzyme A synthetase/AMP-(fatty) acid ligase